MDIRTELKELMENKGFTVLFVATAIGIAKSTVSMWLNGTYKGDNDKITDKVNNFIQRERERSNDEELPIVDVKQAKTGFYHAGRKLVNINGIFIEKLSKIPKWTLPKFSK